MGCNDDNDEYQYNQKEIITIQKSLQKVDSRINVYTLDVESILKRIQPLYLTLLEKSKHLFTLSVLLIKEHERELNN